MSFPPGTVRLEDLQRDHVEIILQPQPSNDPNDPLNWPRWRKNVNFSLASLYVVIVFAMVNMVTVTWGAMGEELAFSFDILNDSYAAGCGALCVGGVFLIPFALKYGRRPLYILTLLLEIGVAIWSARIQNVADLMCINVFSCLVGALCEIMMQMTVADIYFVHQRGLMNTIYVWTLTIGSSLAPLAAGFITVDQNWRWVWWWSTIFLGVIVVLFIFTYEETKYDRATLRGLPDPDASIANAGGALNKEDHEAQFTLPDDSKNPDTLQRQTSITQIEIDPTIPRKTYLQKLAFWSSSEVPLRHYLRHAYQPFLILWHIPAVLYMSILNGAMIASALMPITVYSTYMTIEPYNFTASQIGLVGLPSFIGTLIGAMISGPASDWLILRMAKRNGGIYEPEMRLWLILAFTPFLAAGTLMFGIGLNNGMGWPFICVGLGISAFGGTPASALSLTYLTDAYTEIIGDSMVAIVFVKNLIPTILIFALPPWIEGVGLANVFIIATVVFVVILLGSIIFIIFGKRFRVRTADAYLRFASITMGKARP